MSEKDTGKALKQLKKMSERNNSEIYHNIYDDYPGNVKQRPETAEQIFANYISDKDSERRSIEKFEKLKELVKQQQVKRKPLSDGTLPLTDKELNEFESIYGIGEQPLKKVTLGKGTMLFAWYEDSAFPLYGKVDAISYLLKHFDLEV